MTQPNPRLKCVDVAGMLTTTPPPIPWLVEPLLIPGELSILVGREGRGKSMLSQIVAMALADPGSVDMLPGLTVTPGRVLIIDAENGQPLIHRRLHSAGLRDATNYAVREAVGLDLRAPEHRRELVQAIAQEQPQVVVLDSLASLAPGIRENEAESMAPWMLAIQNIARSTKTAILLLHHASKAGNGSSYRGSSAIGAGVAIEAAMIQHEDDPDPQRRELRWGKVRPVARPEPLWFRITSDDGRLRIEPAEPFESRGAAEPVNQEQAVAARMASELTAAREVLPWQELCKRSAVDPGSGTAKRALAFGINTEQFVRVERGRYASPTVPLGPMDGPTDQEDGSDFGPSVHGPKDSGRTDRTAGAFA